MSGDSAASVLARFDFVERQSDGGFSFTAMRQVRPQHEAQVQRQRGIASPA